jgi:DNA-binding MarR family transcriptional regulator
MTKRQKTVLPVLALKAEDLIRLGAAVRVLRGSGLETLTEAAILALAAEPEVTIAQMVKTLGVPFSTLSRVAWSMSERGLVRYEKHPTDRRKKFVRANLEGAA